jgi:hypothetical protein
VLADAIGRRYPGMNDREEIDSGEHQTSKSYIVMQDKRYMSDQIAKVAETEVRIKIIIRRKELSTLKQ